MNLSSINLYRSISLEETQKVSLMNRIDSKYLLSLDDLASIMVCMYKDYYMLEIGSERLMKYHTVYYDTPDNMLFNDHHRGKLNRYKVRKRYYYNTNTSFLEIKFKNNKGKTEKSRIKADINEYELSYEDRQYISGFLPGLENYLKPVLSNNFKRITLVAKDFTERCTIDIDVRFVLSAQSKHFDDLVIVELKAEASSTGSPLKRLLREKHIQNTGFSKYCIGRSILDPSLKQNGFKQKIREVQKIISN
jgi:hypothetical protein